MDIEKVLKTVILNENIFKNYIYYSKGVLIGKLKPESVKEAVRKEIGITNSDYRSNFEVFDKIEGSERFYFFASFTGVWLEEIEPEKLSQLFIDHTIDIGIRDCDFFPIAKFSSEIVPDKLKPAVSLEEDVLCEMSIDKNENIMTVMIGLNVARI